MSHEDPGPVSTPLKPLGAAVGGCTAACSEMYTFSWPCEQTMVDDLLYEAWCLIANAPGAWLGPSPWRSAAESWRDRWHATIGVGV